MPGVLTMCCSLEKKREKCANNFITFFFWEIHNYTQYRGPNYIKKKPILNEF